MKRWIITALFAAALTAMLIPAAFGQPRPDRSTPDRSLRKQAMTEFRGQAFYMNTRYGALDPWIANLIAREGYRVVSSS